MTFMINQWAGLIVAIVIIIIAIILLIKIKKNPSSVDLTKVQEWLLWAVAEAEKALGGGTGQLKLRYVYDMFVSKFPAIAAVISFEAFSLLVDTALIKFNQLLGSNKKLQQYINGDKKEEEIK